MKIVHEIESPMHVSAGFTPYRNGPGKQGFNGVQVDLFICSAMARNHPDLPAKIFNEEAIYIEGNAKYIVEVLERALLLIKTTIDYGTEKLGPIRSTRCPDNCDDIDRFNGLHAVDCPKHPRHDVLSQEP